MAQVSVVTTIANVTANATRVVPMTHAPYAVIPAYPAFQAWLFMLQLIIMALFARVVNYIFYRFKVPRIVGDMVAGIILGPTVMGMTGAEEMFQPPERATIKIVGNIGLMLASLGAGANFDARRMEGMWIRLFLYSIANILVPFAFGIALVEILPDNPRWFPDPSKPKIARQLFVGTDQAPSALPMAFLILTDLQRSDLVAAQNIGYCMICTIFIFTLTSISDAQSVPNDVFGQGFVPFRITILVPSPCELRVRFL